MKRSDSLTRTTTTAILTALFLALSPACTRQPLYPTPPIVDGTITIDIATLQPDVPRFYTVRYQERNISFFVVRLTTGIQSYLDACVTCFPQRLGYKPMDGRVICRSCDTNYSIYALDKGIGGCYPIRIKGTTVNGTYRIPLVLITAEAGKF